MESEHRLIVLQQCLKGPSRVTARPKSASDATRGTGTDRAEMLVNHPKLNQIDSDHFHHEEY